MGGRLSRVLSKRAISDESASESEAMGTEEAHGAMDIFAAVRSQSLRVAHGESESIAAMALSHSSHSEVIQQQLAAHHSHNLSLSHAGRGRSATPTGAPTPTLASMLNTTNDTQTAVNLKPSALETFFESSVTANDNFSVPPSSVAGQPTQHSLTHFKSTTSLLNRRLGNRSMTNTSTASSAAPGTPSIQTAAPFLPIQAPRTLSNPELSTPTIIEPRAPSSLSPSGLVLAPLSIGDKGPMVAAGLIPPQRLDLSNILSTKIQIDSPMSSAAQKPGHTIPAFVRQHLKPEFIPLWLDSLVRDPETNNTIPGLRAAKVFENAFKLVEEIEGYRLRWCHVGSTQSQSGNTSASSATTTTTPMLFGYTGSIGTKLLGARVSAKEPYFRTSFGRNRYTDIFPFDQSRVVLHHPSPVIVRGHQKLIAVTNTPTASPLTTTVTPITATPAFSNYINASFVDTRLIGATEAEYTHIFDTYSERARSSSIGTLPNGNIYGKRYISAQGPTADTAADFWGMIWDQCSCVIVMLTREEEKGRVKCFKYWPGVSLEDGLSGVVSSAYSNKSFVSMTSANAAPTGRLHVWDHGNSGYVLEVYFLEKKVQRNGEVVVRQFEVTRYRKSDCVCLDKHHHLPDCVASSNSPSKNNEIESENVVERRIVYHIQYLGWPDHKSADPASVLSVVDTANTLQRQCGDNMGPMVVHCSAGCGRTGTFCVIDSVLYRLKHETNTTESNKNVPITLDDDYIFQTVMTLRAQRVSMVQTLDQYVFCYEAVIAWLMERQDVGNIPTWQSATIPEILVEPASEISPLNGPVDSAESPARPTGGWKLKVSGEKRLNDLYSPVSVRPAYTVPPTPGGVGGGNVGAFDWDAALTRAGRPLH